MEPGGPLEERTRALLAAGDERGAATVVLRELGPHVLRYLRSVLRSESDAAEAFSAFAEDLWRGLPAFRWEAPLRSWAFRVAWRAALGIRNDTFRRHGRRLETGEAAALADELHTTAPRLEGQRQSLDALRDALSPEEQSLLVLRVDQQLPWEEVSLIQAGAADPRTVATLRKKFERLKDRLGRLARARGLID
ncbi:RNA polymerase sigma factor [Anaeromyxobacter terrae]|uniref:RNA polymerase sigma factor n=1 Tax=Anaeromyxobacter terrae TaxID=2925406 RepID=UPI001F571565|nr:sigma factor [Anaeromyxobacter sp. SG22]